MSAVSVWGNFARASLRASELSLEGVSLNLAPDHRLNPLPTLIGSFLSQWDANIDFQI